MGDTDRMPYGPPQVEKRAPKPPGILPKNAQNWLIAGLALVMVIVFALSGTKAPKEGVAAPSRATSVVDPNDARIQEYRARIEQQAQKLALEQARLFQARQALGTPPVAAAQSAMSGLDPDRTSGVLPSDEYTRSATVDRQENWIELDREKREYESRYASNVALSRRDAPESLRGQTPDDWSAPRAEMRPPTKTAASAEVEGEPRQASARTYRVFEGTVIETVLTNRLDGSFSGPVNCMVTTNVYSHDRMQLLIPKGSRVLGGVSRVEAFGQQRLAVTFHRLIMPDGYAVSLEKLPGLSGRGETGLVDQVNHHYLQVFGVSLAIGAIAGLSQANTRYGVNASADDAYRQGVASSLSQSSLNILDRYLNVLPTFTIREGHRIKVYLTGDLLLPAYTRHRMPNDL